VSRALNGYPDIAEATQLRVRRAAERMGYRPMAQAQAIRTGRARSLGLVLNAGRSDAHKPFLTDFLDGISRAASEESWTLTVATAEDETDEVATMARLVDERKVDGFILPRTKTRDARIALLRAREVPFILYGRTLDDTGCAWFDIDGEGAIRAAVLRLAGLATSGSAISAGCRTTTIPGCVAGVSRRDARGRAGARPRAHGRWRLHRRGRRQCGADAARPRGAADGGGLCAGRGGTGPLPRRAAGGAWWAATSPSSPMTAAPRRHPPIRR
jgi:hypothetical protein